MILIQNSKNDEANLFLCCCNSRSREEAATLLGLLISASQRLTKPYVAPMLNVLLPKSRDASPSVAASILTTLGEIARVGGEDLVPEVPSLMSLILETLHDQASTPKRDAALRTLGQLASHSGYVIDPYLDHPSLLGLLIGLLKTEPAQHTRREVIRVMGILGALDPYRHTVCPFCFSSIDFWREKGLNFDFWVGFRSWREYRMTLMLKLIILPTLRILLTLDLLTMSIILLLPLTLSWLFLRILPFPTIIPPLSTPSCTSSDLLDLKLLLSSLKFVYFHSFATGRELNVLV